MFNFYDISNVLKYSIIYSLAQFWFYQSSEVCSINYTLGVRDEWEGEKGKELASCL